MASGAIFAKLVSQFDDKGFQQAGKSTDNISSKLKGFAKTAGVAFAAAGAAAAAYGVKLAVDGVKAAVEDQQAQEKLAASLKRTTNATDAQIASTEDWITKQGIAYGVTDDQLRPALDRLARSTGDVEEAQSLASLAMDISAGTGKSLEAVTNSLAKAYDGNLSSLNKLGAGFSKEELKTMSFHDAVKGLSDTFGGAAATNAETFQGKMDRLKLAFSEAQETVGGFILDAITPFVTTVVEKVIPAVAEWASTLGENLKPTFVSLNKWIQETFIPTIQTLWAYITNVIVPAFKQVWPDAIKLSQKTLDSLNRIIGNLSSAINILTGNTASSKDQTNNWTKALSAAVGWADRLITPVLKLVEAFSSLVEQLAKLRKVWDGIWASGEGLADLIGKTVGNIFGGGKALGGSVRGGTSYLVGENGPEIFTPMSNGHITPNNQLGSTINIHVSGALDPEAVARQIQQILQQSAARSGAYRNLGFAPNGLA